uniref:Apple domain-containing protein n=1 Tax=Tetranychus urticae TaxID=32264 RepID=T1KQG2_TETUR
MSDGELVIDTDLHVFTHESEVDGYTMKELVSASESAITGKIQVSNFDNNDSYDIYYQFDRSGKDNKERLVIHGNDCTLYNHSKMTQNANLFGDNKPLRDLILLMGPSIIYRLDGQSTVWSQATQHGLSRKLITTVVNKTLEITFDFDDKYTHGNILKIEFNGYNRSTKSPEVELYLLPSKKTFETRIGFYSYGPSPYPPEENSFLEFHKIGSDSIQACKRTTFLKFTAFEYLHSLHLGIGCPNYLIPRQRKPIPKLWAILLMRLKTNFTGVNTEVIYDNELGIILTLEEGGRCWITIGDRNSPGRDAKGYFKLENLFFFDGDFNYVRKDYFVDQFKFPVDAWESVQFNVDFEGNKVDKFVVTQYFVESPNSIIFNGSALVQTMISIYDSDSSKKSYALAKRIIRGYNNMRKIEAGEKELYDYFMPNDCKYLLNDRKVTLNFKIACEALNTDCIKLANRLLVQFRIKFIDAILLYQTISPLRIDDIQYRSSDSQIEINVTFLDKPNFDDLIKPEKMLVSNETFDVARTLSASNESECLYQLGLVRGLFSVGIWRSSDSFCGYLKKFRDFKEDAKNGESCNVYILPFENYYRISHELALDDLQKSFLENKFKTFSMEDPESHEYIVKVGEFERDVKESDITLYHEIGGNSKIRKDDKTTLVVPGIAEFSDCLRVCQKSEGLDSNKETDSKCSIFTMNALRFYSKVPNRKFKKQISTAIRQSATSCAQECLHSDDCISFQDCGYSCSFNSLYTDSTTEYDEVCAIYYPKVYHEYRNTGNKIVSEVIHTEMNLNLDQCASLCHGWTDGDTGCKSFNYCPRNINQMESSCSLTKYSVKSSDANSTDEGYCFNYEFITQSNDNTTEESSETQVIKGATPCVYEKIKPKRVFAQLNESLTWTKQVAEQPGITKINMSNF